MIKTQNKLIAVLATVTMINVMPSNAVSNSGIIEGVKHESKLEDVEMKIDSEKSEQEASKSDGSWISDLQSMPTSRHSLATAVVDNKIYAIGGKLESPGTLRNQVEVYDPSTNTWQTKAPMPTARQYLKTMVVNGKIYAIGGYGSSASNKVEVYDPKTDTWDTSRQSMPTAKSNFGSVVIGTKIYTIGGTTKEPTTGNPINKVEVYDTETDSWETKSAMPTARYGIVSEVINNKIYVIGGKSQSTSLDTMEIYDPISDTWTTSISNMPTARHNLTGSVVEGNIYCMGGVNGSVRLKTLEVYDPTNDRWTVLPEAPTPRGAPGSATIGNKIYVIGGWSGSQTMSTMEAYVVPGKEYYAEKAVERAESSKEPIDIEIARDLVNQLSESSKKDELQDRLNAESPNISMDLKKATSNLDIYIKSDNMLSLSLDTNSVTFDDFSGVEDIEKQNAITLTVNSSLPYKVNAYLPTEITGNKEPAPMNKSILNIKANSEAIYKTFTDLVTPITLLDNQVEGNNISHGIDLMLKGGIAHEKDVYKATIKLEVEQK